MKIQKSIIFLIAIAFSFSQTIYSQITARTENGRQVLLMDDGTWKYADEGGGTIYTELRLNPIAQYKPYSANQSISSSHIDVKVYFDSKMWEYNKISPAEAREYEFWSKWGDGKAILTTEERQVKIDELRIIAASNAFKMVPDIRVTREELRKVNDFEVLCIDFEGTIQGVPQIFQGYYYSGSKGTVQFLAYASQDFFSENRKAFGHLLNGLMIGK